MKKTALIALCLVMVCLLLTACHADNDTTDATEQTVVAISPDDYQLLHAYCVSKEGASVIEKRGDYDSLSANTYMIGSFGLFDQSLPSAFSELTFDEDTTEAGYLDALRSALFKVLPEGNAVDKLSVSVSTLIQKDDIHGNYYKQFVPMKEIVGSGSVEYTFQFWATIGEFSSPTITVNIKNGKVESVELYDLSSFVPYLDIVIDQEALLALAREVSDEWKQEREDERYSFDTVYRLVVSDGALYFEVKTSVIFSEGMCGQHFGDCIHYIKLAFCEE